jgi:hypothetical protein
MHRARVAHEVLPRGWVAGEKLQRQHRSLFLIAALARRDEVARIVTPTAREGNHMIKGGILQSQNISAIDTSTSTVAKGGSLDLTLVLLVEQAASVPGNPAGGAGERDVVDEPM